MNKKLLIFMATILLITNIAYADIITFKNGEQLEGNIIRVYKDTITIDVVLDGKLVGCKMTIDVDELSSIILSDTYRELTKIPMTEDEIRKNREMTKNRFAYLNKLQEQQYQWEVKYSNQLRRQQRQDLLLYNQRCYEATLLNEVKKRATFTYRAGEGAESIIKDATNKNSMKGAK